MCTSFKKELLDGVHNFKNSGGGTFKLALYTSSATLGAATTAYATTNEVTGTNYTAGGATDNYISACTNTTDNTVNVVWVDPSTSDYLQIKIATISGTAFSFGASIVVNNASSIESAVVYDSANNKVVVGWADTSNSYYGKSKVGTSNGATGMTFGTATTFSSAFTAYISGSFDSTQNKATFAYIDVADSYKGKASTGTVSGTSISFTDPVTLYSGGTVNLNNLVFDPDTASFVYSNRALPNSSGRSLVYKQGTGPNVASFVGITEAAIANAATGAVTLQGGINTTAITNTATTTFAITVANPGSGNKYYIDGALQATVSLSEGRTYKFDQSDGTNGGHPLRFSTTSDGTHGGGSEYTTGVTVVGVPGNSGAYTQIVVAIGAPTLYYYCTAHSGMGGTANTPDDARFTVGSTYYVQNDGTLGTGSTSIVAGEALSATSINLVNT